MSDDPTSRARNVVLVGFMGAGKTSVGKRVAQNLGFVFVDTDELIVNRAGMPITRIFADEGEEAFRDIETAVLEDLFKVGDCKVVSTGGGIVLRGRNRELMRRLGFVVWLSASEEVVWERVRRNRGRPLLQNDDPRGTIRSMLTDRRALYEEASDLNVDTDDLDLGEVSCGIVECARVAFGM